jgi:glyoxylase-like metal-dependent hydrolase (beta-lactamase superfamily II)
MLVTMTYNVKSLLSLIGFLLFCQSVLAFELETVKVAEDVYALVGETGPRTYENHALNNNVGFIVADQGVILIDSGASPSGAKLIEQSILRVTDKPVKWVVNTGSQDHRWLGNSYFKQKGAEVIALNSTVEEQRKHIETHLDRLKNTIRENAIDVKPVQASRVLKEAKNQLNLGNKQLQVIFPGDSHFPGDGIVWLPGERVVFSGDLVYVDRILGIQSYSPVASWLQAFNKMANLKPLTIIPGHGSVSDMDKAQKQTGDYLAYLITGVKKALDDWSELDETVIALTETADQFKNLQNFDSWHKLNINRTYLQLEAVQ